MNKKEVENEKVKDEVFKYFHDFNDFTDKLSDDELSKMTDVMLDVFFDFDINYYFKKIFGVCPIEFLHIAIIGNKNKKED